MVECRGHTRHLGMVFTSFGLVESQSELFPPPLGMAQDRCYMKCGDELLGIVPHRLCGVFVQQMAWLFHAKVGWAQGSRTRFSSTDTMSIASETHLGFHQSSEHLQELPALGLRSCCSEIPPCPSSLITKGLGILPFPLW